MPGQNSPVRLLEHTRHFSKHERAKAELKGLLPEDAQQAIGHGVRAKRSKSGAITLELLNAEDGYGTV
jgi:hypothetical protein